MKDKILELLDKESDKTIKNEFRRLIAFIDASIIQIHQHESKDQLANFMKNILNMRDYLTNELFYQNAKIDLKKSIEELYNQDVNKKKEEELEEQEPLQENLLEIDR
tara:strand:- start:617 stop:937 length:321 start_codon:yes stop_codon:yes gene_type:complete